MMNSRISSGRFYMRKKYQKIGKTNQEREAYRKLGKVNFDLMIDRL